MNNFNLHHRLHWSLRLLTIRCLHLGNILGHGVEAGKPEIVGTLLHFDLKRSQTPGWRFRDPGWNFPSVLPAQRQQTQKTKQTAVSAVLPPPPPGKNLIKTISELLPEPSTTLVKMWRKDRHRKIRPRSSRARNPLHEMSSSSDDSSNQAQGLSNLDNANQRPCAHYSGENNAMTEAPGGKNYKNYKNYKNLKFITPACSHFGNETTRLYPYNLAISATFVTISILKANIRGWDMPTLVGRPNVVVPMSIHSKTSVSLTVKRSPVKRSRMTPNDTTYTVMVPPSPFTNQEQDPVLDTTGPNSSGTSSTRGNLQSLAIAINVNDDVNNNDVVGLSEIRSADVEMGPNEQVLARNRAINAMEAATTSPTSSIEILSVPNLIERSRRHCWCQ